MTIDPYTLFYGIVLVYLCGVGVGYLIWGIGFPFRE